MYIFLDLRTLVLGLNGKPGIEVSDFLFRVAFMKIDTLTNIELNNRLSVCIAISLHYLDHNSLDYNYFEVILLHSFCQAGGAIMQQWKSMGRELRKSCNTD